jgi:hypothetical protein
MAVTEWLASGTSADTSLELTLAEGESATISVFRDDGEPMDPSSRADLLIKGSNTEYNPTGFSLTRETPTLTLSSAGVFVVSRSLATGAFGVDHDGGIVGDA